MLLKAARKTGLDLTVIMQDLDKQPLKPLIIKHSPTAIIAPRDYSAVNYLSLFHLNQIRIPHHYSLISFDNSHFLAESPINSIDHGMTRLGVHAFQWIAREIKVRRNRQGELPARPFVVERGSVKTGPVFNR